MSWMDYVNLGSGIATAAFAGIGVWLIQMERLAKIVTRFDIGLGVDTLPTKNDWSPKEADPTALEYVSVRATVKNNTDRAITVRGMAVYGLPLTRNLEDRKRKIVPYRGGYYEHLEELIERGGERSFHLGSDVDWRSAPKASTKLWASLIIDRNSLIPRKLSRTDMSIVSAETIQKNAAKAVQNA